MSIIIADPPAVPTPTPAAPRIVFMLCHPSAPSGYAFTPASGVDDATVEVVRTDKRTRDVYVLAVEDARTLWRFLCAKGYEVF